MGHAVMAAAWLIALLLYAALDPQTWVHGAGILLALVTVAMFLSLHLAARLGRQLRSLTRAAREIAGGDFRPKMLPRFDDELDDLATAMESLGRELESHIGALTRNEARLRAILDNMVSGVLLVSSSGRIDLCNAAAARMADLDPASVPGRHYLQVIRNSRIHRMIEECMTSRSHASGEISLDHPKDLTLEVTVVPVSSTAPEDPGGVLVTLYDITELRLLERARTEFVANISHELKTPLTVMKGFAETLVDLTASKSRKEKSPEAVACSREDCAELARTIHEETERLSRLVQDLLDLARMESGNLTMNWDQHDVVELVTRVARQATPLAARARLSLELFVPEEPIVATVDAARLEQGVFNLVHNAILYTPPGGHVSISVGTDSGSGDVAIKVVDTGTGIPQEVLPRVFERFYRVGKDRSRETGGTGLGLSIVKHVVEAHGGRVSVESTLGKGTKFCIRIPAARDQRSRRSTPGEFG